MSSPRVYTHPAPLVTLLPALAAHLPSALPILRRVQFHMQGEAATVLATFAPDDPSPGAFAALFLDRSRAPETEAWLYSSLEAEAPPLRSAAAHESAADPTAVDPAASLSRASALQHRTLVLSLLEHANSLPLPAAFPADRPPNVLKIGAVHGLMLALLKGVDACQAEWARLASGAPAPAAAAGEHVVSLDAALASGFREGTVRAETVPYVKFVRAPLAVAPPEDALPAALVWDVGHATDYALVISRTAIPRTARTLALMPSAVVRVRGDRDTEGDWDGAQVLADLCRAPGRPVGWTFLGPDGSLASLHVEPDWRGEGLAKMLARRAAAMLDSGAEGDWAGGPAFRSAHTAAGWTHADVARDNPASTAVVRSTGAKEAWECFWTEIDIGVAALEREGDQRDTQ